MNNFVINVNFIYKIVGMRFQLTLNFSSIFIIVVLYKSVVVILVLVLRRLKRLISIECRNQFKHTM